MLCESPRADIVVRDTFDVAILRSINIPRFHLVLDPFFSSDSNLSSYENISGSTSRIQNTIVAFRFARRVGALVG
jgi:hypothetical protein